MMERSELKSLTLEKDDNGVYSLRAVYHIFDEANNSKKEFIIPKIHLPIYKDSRILIGSTAIRDSDVVPSANIGFGYMELFKGETYPGEPLCYYSSKRLEEPLLTSTDVAEMICKLEEQGYKIEFAGKKEEEKC